MDINHFSRIVILESLPENEWKTFNFLRDDIEAVSVFHDRDVSIDTVSAKTEKDFWGELEKLKNIVVESGDYPILHIECHGSEDKKGLVLSDNTFISWEELKPLFTEINIATKCNFFITLAICNGAYLGEIILPMDRAPCWGVLGPTEESESGHLLASYTAFYKELLTSLDGNKALSKLNSSAENKVRYSIITAEWLFRSAFKNYLSKHATNTEYWRRAKKARQELQNNDTKSPSTQDIVQMYKISEKPTFYEYLERFFMADIYPENKNRFYVTYEEIIKEVKELS